MPRVKMSSQYDLGKGEEKPGPAGTDHTALSCKVYDVTANGGTVVDLGTDETDSHFGSHCCNNKVAVVEFLVKDFYKRNRKRILQIIKLSLLLIHLAYYIYCVNYK
ncbi:hypothetical protein PoB_007433800 [Plakobranchus ocellatus]|uniref:Uncharacterized protein n=1 Tax=Plakobranchus ocellatus TaxID=259542 RepID=A0AAV4DU12_9GAST|nr:hypothetical protein PoB_007433800 [Plakobranchus ocellatus]